MKAIFPFLLLLVSLSSINAQKPVLDTSTFGKWPDLINVQITADGKYAAYDLVDNFAKTTTLVIQSTNTTWKYQASHVSGGAVFTDDNTTAIFLTSQDSLAILSLGTSHLKYIPSIASFRLSPEEGQRWLAYLHRSDSTFTLLNLHTRQESQFRNVLTYTFSSDGKILLLRSASGKDAPQHLDWIDLDSQRQITIWKGATSNNYTFDTACRQLVFTASQLGGTDAHTTIYYYKIGMNEAKALDDDQTLPKDSSLSLAEDRPFFNLSGNAVFFFVKPQISPKSALRPTDHSPYIWNFKDKYLPFEQIEEVFPFFVHNHGLVMQELNDHSLHFLTQPTDQIYSTAIDNYVFTSNQHSLDSYYRKDARSSLYCIATNTAERKTIVDHGQMSIFGTSPGRHCFLWFDYDSLAYFSYDIVRGTIKNITRSVPANLYDESAVKDGRTFVCLGMAGWGTKDESIYLYDQYDIWKVYLQGERSPENITHGYGRLHKIVFSFSTDNSSPGGFPLTNTDVVPPLVGFNTLSKDNGFWIVQPGKDPLALSMAPSCYYIPRTAAVTYDEHANGYQPIKAKSKSTYIVRRMTTADYPNLYITSDFRTFKPLTDIHPQCSYNWLRSKLITWTMTDGQPSQGILYLPDNFDSTKRYPVIFTYYERRTDQLHQYLTPEYSEARINIPYYVSNGYLIFVPDIYYPPGHNGEGVVNSVVSAARFLCTFRWVDSNKLGLQGHSFGAWETNFLITHSHRFAAACEAAGVADQVSAYDQLNNNGQGYYELGSQGTPFGLGVTPWSHLENYIENSPVFFVDRVTTPLLMAHGTKDLNVPFPQAIEMYLALRRAGKRVWLLEYLDADHGFYGDYAKDYTIRMKQFFDYYLQNAPPPKWMTQGVPVENSGIYSGSELDTTGARP